MNLRLVHFVDEVMAEHFQQCLIDLGRGSLAPHLVAELTLHGRERRFEVAARMW